MILYSIMSIRTRTTLSTQRSRLFEHLDKMAYNNVIDMASRQSERLEHFPPNRTCVHENTLHIGTLPKTFYLLLAQP